MPQIEFDVFLSHNSVDKPFVEEIAKRLKEEKLRPFLDKWNLVPGAAWQPELEAAMKSCATAAIIFGSIGDGPWHNAEMQVLLNRAQRERGEFRLIPVLLEGANPATIGSFIELRTWVDFGKDPFDVALKRLIAGIKGEPPEDGSGYNLPDEPAPYRSLLRFEVRHADYFFGRNPDIEKLVQRLAQQTFVAVVGASGSGKSSLVRAGLATTLAREKLPALSEWQTLTVIPGSRPLRELARAFLKMINVVDADMADRLDKEVTRYRHDDRAFVDQLLDRDGTWLVVIDQFEEVFTQTQLNFAEAGSLRHQAEGFIAVLNRTVQLSGGRIRVLLTLRADFLHRGLDFPVFKSLLQDNQFLLGQLEDTGLREAIVRPANKVGALFEKGLVERILSDVLGQSGSLPLLEHALHELWQKRRGAWLTNAAYDETGGVDGALRKRADETYAGLTERQQQIARNIFVRLTTLGEGVSDTRRRANRSELYLSGFDHAEIDDVLKSLSGDQARLIEVSEGTVEVTHEAVIQKWSLLRRWLDANRAALGIHRRLTDAANEWSKSHHEVQKRDSSLLYTGTRLAVAQELSDRQDQELNDQERNFLDASVGAIKQRRRRIFGIAAGSIATVLLAIAIGTWEWRRSFNKQHAEEKVAALFTSEIEKVPYILQEILGYRRWADPPLRKKLAEGPNGSPEKLRAALALLSVEPVHIEYLREQLLVVQFTEFPIVLDALEPYAQEITSALWVTANDSAIPIARRFQAACALAKFSADDERWKVIGMQIAQRLVGLPAAEHVAWREALSPAGKQLLQPLAMIFRKGSKDTQIRQFAAETLAEYASNNGSLLGELILDADPKTFELLFGAAIQSPIDLIGRLKQELGAVLEPQWDDAPVNPTWKSIDADLLSEIQKLDGLIDERFAICLSLSVAKLVDLCESLRPAGYRPVSVVTWPRGSETFASVVWTRDGGDWKLAGPITPEAALRLDKQYRQAGLMPMVVDLAPPFGKEQFVLWGPQLSGSKNDGIDTHISVTLQPAAMPTSIPITWSVKLFRFDPGADGEPPTAINEILKVPPFLDTVLNDKKMEVDFSAEYTALNNLRRFVLTAVGTVELESGEYQLGALANEGVRVYVDGKMVLDRWADGHRAPVVTSVQLQAGPHELNVQCYQVDGDHKLSVRLGYPHVYVATPPIGESLPAAASQFESQFANAIDVPTVLAEVQKLVSKGFRPIGLIETSSATVAPSCAVSVACHRPIVTEDAKDVRARRQSHAAAALARLGKVELIWPHLAFRPSVDQPETLDPRSRTELIHDLAEYRVDSGVLLERLRSESDASIRRAILLALGQYSDEGLPLAARAAQIDELLVEYENDPDAGLHGAIEWLLRHWGHAEDLRRVVDRSKHKQTEKEEYRPLLSRNWYVNSQGQSFTIFDSGEFLMGSPESEPEREPEELQHQRRIKRSFALATTEVKHAQYLLFTKTTGALDPRNPYIRTNDSPQTGITWFEAARYCNWLSEQDGIGREQWCFEPNEQGDYGPGMKTKPEFLDLVGYRLPTEAEWEYACRAGAKTTRHFGNSEGRLEKYSWYSLNSHELLQPVGEKLPNDAGLFDTLGNAMEWCHDAAFPYSVNERPLLTLPDPSANMDASLVRILRGGSYYLPAKYLRAGARQFQPPLDHDAFMGLRPARTCPCAQTQKHAFVGRKCFAN